MAPHSLIPLFPGLPGGPELLVLLLVMVLLLGVPVVLVLLGVAGGVSVLGRSDERIEELESRIEELEREREDDP